MKFKVTRTSQWGVGHDMRDFRGISRFSGCRIEFDPNVVIVKEENDGISSVR